MHLGMDFLMPFLALWWVENSCVGSSVCYGEKQWLIFLLSCVSAVNETGLL